MALNDPIQPFLRWAGGKQQLLSQMAQYLPEDVRNRQYIEPFAGAASMLLAVKPTSGILSDSNELLMRCFGHIRDNPERIADYLMLHLIHSSEKYYYQIRDRFNKSNDSIAQAARFIYLNKTCFNGIYRVNQQGIFNVPYGHKNPPSLPTRRDLKLISQVLANIDLYTADFKDILDIASKDNFVYLDPPYPPLNGTSYFTHYTANRFNWDDHIELAHVFQKLCKRGCLVMMSNADHPRIRKLFANYKIHKLNVIRYITCKNVKHKAITR